MAPPISNTSAEPTLYDILALTPKHLEGQAGAAQQQKIVKQAYHRALLKHHPDKAASGPPASSSSPSSPSASASSPNPSGGSKSKSSPKAHAKQGSHSQPRIAYTVDQIQHAYAVLSDAKQRREYDRLLRASPAQRHQQTQSSFQTGVETVDLDDVSFDEQTGVYYRPCRCGNARGYAFTEENLEEFEEDGVLMVECLDCSLWVRVLFAAAEDEEPAANNVATVVNPGGSRGPRDEAVAPRGRGEDIAVTTSGEQRGAGTGRGFTFNWSFNWGISLSGTAASSSATIETGSSSRR
ncbi:uncharacterized protein F4807DRAFT_461264 [Annulohypoxylon truncatum]|uniref:uncharacterized protein n=1 Tax=Annulohypoxylon truncatum TaxID=327061 RepID=UPI0020071DFF|nr:uncharacterized protein F4807DRAFT_461264 [Annulohypoxylon truncatum]KAI1208723.1 hypothetical protein F4807DRAFT_461264 [Annulohypoxylon truncatum]